jgi:predicted aldo/keto reductase-like oxidoreductase
MNRRSFFRTIPFFLTGRQLLKNLSHPETNIVPYANLGNTGLMVSKLGFDCSAFHLESVSENEIGNIIHTALELGFNYFDVAPVSGTAAKKMGSSIIDVREKMILAAEIIASAENPLNTLEKSLTNLKTDFLDLVYLNLPLHWPQNFSESDCTQVIGENHDKLIQAKNQGMVRHLGIAGTNSTLIQYSIASGKAEVVKTPANLVVPHLTDLQDIVWKVAKSKHTGLVGSDILGGKNHVGEYRIPSKYYNTAFQYALDLKYHDMVMVSINSMEETVQAIQLFNHYYPSRHDSDELARRIGKKLSQKKLWRQLYHSS